MGKGQMEPKWLDTILAAVLLIVFGFLGVLLALGWPTSDPGWAAFGAVGSWAAALGTFAAAGVALWLGWREGAWRRESEQQAALRSRLYLLSIRNVLIEARSELQQLLDLQFGRKQEFDHVAVVQWLESVLDQLWKIDVERVAAYNSKEATDLALARSELDQARRVIRQVLERRVRKPDRFGPDTERRIRTALAALPEA